MDIVNLIGYFSNRFSIPLKAYLMCMKVLSRCTSVYYNSWCPGRLEEDIRSSGTQVTDRCELLFHCWESNLGPQEEQQVLFTWTISSAPSVSNTIV